MTLLGLAARWQWSRLILIAISGVSLELLLTGVLLRYREPFYHSSRHANRVVNVHKYPNECILFKATYLASSCRNGCALCMYFMQKYK